MRASWLVELGCAIPGVLPSKLLAELLPEVKRWFEDEVYERSFPPNIYDRILIIISYSIVATRWRHSDGGQAPS